MNSTSLGLALLVLSFTFGCNDDPGSGSGGSGGSDAGGDGGSSGGAGGTENESCPEAIPSEGDPCRGVVGNCTYTGCPEGQITGGGETWSCPNGEFVRGVVDYNCRPGTSSSTSGSSGTGM